MHKLSFTYFRYVFVTTCLVFVFTATTFAQQPFNKAEFVARRARLFDKISDGVVVVFAARGRDLQPESGARNVARRTGTCSSLVQS